MRRLALSLLTVAVLACATPDGTQAQGDLSRSSEMTPDEKAKAAFSEPYGKLLAAEFARIVTDSVDSDCLKTKNVDRATLSERAHGILVRQGTQMFDILDRLTDRAAYDKAFSANAGNFKTLWAQLRNDPDVKTFIAVSRALMLARAADQIVENFDRAALLLRIKLARRLHPLATGNQALLDANPTERYLDKLDELIANSKSDALQRYVKFADAADDAVGLALRREALAKLGPVQLMDGLEQEMAEICIGRGSS